MSDSMFVVYHDANVCLMALLMSFIFELTFHVVVSLWVYSNKANP